MKNVILAVVLAVISLSCSKSSVNSEAKTTEELLVLNNWKLDRYTDESGKSISSSSLNTSANVMFSMNFIFSSDFVTKAIEPLTKTVLNRGTWSLNADKTLMNINITGFKDDFKLVNISKGNLTLQPTTKTLLSNNNIAINMVFVAAQ